MEIHNTNHFVSFQEFQIKAEISELDINKIETQDKVKISIEAISEIEEFEGEVVSVNPGKILKEGDIYYEVTILPKEEIKELKPGMTADLLIITQKKENTLKIPRRALIKEGRKYFVRIPQETGYQKREVKIGIQNDREVEILDGLKEKEKVITYFEE